MLATDNHIGYLERDPVRGQDAINTFKEVLELAVKYDVSRSPVTRYKGVVHLLRCIGRFHPARWGLIPRKSTVKRLPLSNDGPSARTHVERQARSSRATK